MSNNDASQALKAILGGGIVAFHSVFARAINVNCGLMLSQGLFWQENAKYRDVFTFQEHGEKPFFQKTAAEWHEETGLSTEQQATAREMLMRLGILIEKKAGLPAKLYFHIDLEALVSVVNQYKITGLPVSVKAKNKFPEKSETKIPENPETVIGENRKQYIGIESIESFDSLKESDAQSAFPLSEKESDYVKIETWSAETKLVSLNTASLKQDAPGGGASLNQYSDTDEQLLKERDPRPARSNKKNTTEEPPKGMSMAEFIKPIERLNAELQRHLNMPGHTFCRLNANGNLKRLKRLFKETGCSPDEAADVVAYIVGKWVGTKFQDNLTPDTLFAPSNFVKYRGWYEMNKTAPAKPQAPTTPPRRVQMDEPDFNMYGEKQAF